MKNSDLVTELRKLEKAYLDAKHYKIAEARHEYTHALLTNFPALIAAVEGAEAVRETLQHALIAIRTCKEFVVDSRQYIGIELEQQMEAALAAAKEAL